MSGRLDLITALIRKFQYDSYLEIGCRDDETFKDVPCKNKVGVDPEKGGTHRQTSDVFFDLILTDTASIFWRDLIFIDGLHTKEQVMKDVDNSLICLDNRGVIVVHDCIPKTEECQLSIEEFRDKYDVEPPDGRPWNGDVWKGFWELAKRPDIDLAILDQDWGCGVIVPRKNTCLMVDEFEDGITWDDFDDVYLANIRIYKTIGEMIALVKGDLI